MTAISLAAVLFLAGAPGAPTEAFHGDIQALCAGGAGAMESARGREIAAAVADTSRPKAHRVVILRDAAREAGLARCPRLAALLRSDRRVRRPPPMRPLKQVETKEARGHGALDLLAGGSLGAFDDAFSGLGGGLGPAAAPGDRVHVGALTLTGHCPHDAVERAARDRARALGVCLASGGIGAKRPAGTANLAWKIDGQGRAAAVATKLEPPDAALADCLTRKVSRWTFPAPPTGETCGVELAVSYTAARMPPPAQR